METFFIRFASATARVAGKPWTFIACLSVVLIWAATGPVFKFSETWQLIINTGTTIVTFLMVFLIQNTQNRDAAAMQAKLDELLHAVTKADEGFIGIEHLTDKELALILRQVEKRAERLHGGNHMPVVATRAEDDVRDRRTPAKKPAPRKPAAKPKAKGAA